MFLDLSEKIGFVDNFFGFVDNFFLDLSTRLVGFVDKLTKLQVYFIPKQLVV